MPASLARTARRLTQGDGADALRRAIALRITIRFLSGASRLAIKRMQRTVVRASKLALPPPLIRSALGIPAQKP